MDKRIFYPTFPVVCGSGYYPPMNVTIGSGNMPPNVGVSYDSHGRPVSIGINTNFDMDNIIPIDKMNIHVYENLEGLDSPAK